jgi:hypothetical protein
MRPLGACVLAVAVMGWLASTDAHAAQWSGRRVVLFVDDLHFDFRSSPRVRDLLSSRILPAVGGQGQAVGIVTTGQSPVSTAPTMDLGLLRSRLRSIMGNGLRADDILDERGSTERRRRARVALAAARDTIQFLSASGTGRALIVYVSDGYGESALTGELDEIAAAASRARATVYTVDSHGLVGPTPELTASNWSRWDGYRVIAQDGLRRLAEGTGGRLIWTPADLDSALERIGSLTDRQQ